MQHCINNLNSSDYHLLNYDKSVHISGTRFQNNVLIVRKIYK